jgi:hypothetical protein
MLTVKYTQGGGVAERKAPTVLHPAISAAPNPFLRQTTVRFVLPRSCPMVLEVLDVSGSVVKVLPNRLSTAGWHSVVWDGTDDSGARVPAGVYVVILEAGEAKARTKVVMSE